MKKFLKSFLIVLICVCTCLSFVGCGKPKLSETTNDNKQVVSNDGVAVYYDQWLYFINGTKSVNEPNVKAKNVQSAIYRVKTKADGTIDYKEPENAESESSDSEDEEVTREFTKIERVVSSLTGFDEGSLFIFGGFLYYSTPCTSRNRDGEMLYGKTVFKRYDLKTKAEQTLYTTVQSDDTIDYTYYKQGKTLNLVVFEKNNKTVSSFKIGTKIETNFVEKDVTACVLSQNSGDSYSASAKTNAYIYFTLNYDEDSAVLKGSRVFRVLPDGTARELISEGHTLTLITIKNDFLIYSEESSGSTIVYAQKFTGAKDEKLSFAQNDIVCYKSYENIVFIEENNKISALVFDGTWIRKISYDNNEIVDDKINYKFGTNDQIAFIGTDGDYVIYQLTSSSNSSSTNLIYKIKYKNVDVENNEENYPIKLSTTKLDAASGRMAPEIINGYIYGFYTDTSYKTTYLYRISIETPKNDDGSDKEVGKAEFIGVKE